jgi:hypothetical protein
MPRRLPWFVALGVAAGLSSTASTGCRRARTPDDVAHQPVTPTPVHAPVAPESRALPQPPDDLLEALRHPTPDGLERTLPLLSDYAATPEVDAALALLSRGPLGSDRRRFITCLRSRPADAALSSAFEVLPTAPSRDPEWRQPGTRCLVQLIAARAEEEPDRAVAVLAEQAVESKVRDRSLISALLRLDPPELPDVVRAGLRESGTFELSPGRRRIAAVETAVALGAAAKWPELLDPMLGDPDSRIRHAAIEMLIARRDDASLAAAARAVAAEPNDEVVVGFATAALRDGTALDRHLADLAADSSVPMFARAQAVFLVSRAGGEPAARRVVALRGADSTLGAELEAARGRVANRFGRPGGVR